MRCLFDRFSIWNFGSKWPLVKIFENIFPDSATGHRNTFRDQIWWKLAVAKFPKGRLVYHTKKTRAPRNSSQSPFCPTWADRAQNYLNVVTPWRVHVYPIWSGSAVCRTIPERLIFRPKKSLQYRLSTYKNADRVLMASLQALKHE